MRFLHHFRLIESAWERQSIFIKQAMSPQAVEKLRLRYPDHQAEFNFLVERDPSSDNKYLMWAMRQVKKGENVEKLAVLLFNYHRLQNEIPGNLDSYPTVTALEAEIQRVPLSYRPYQVPKPREGIPDYVANPPPGVKYVGSSGGYDAFDIDTYEGAQALGTTSWCIVTNKEHWDSYISKGSKFRFLVDGSAGLPAKYALETYLDRDGEETEATRIWGPTDYLVGDPHKILREHAPTKTVDDADSIRDLVNGILNGAEPVLTDREVHEICRSFSVDTVISVIAQILTWENKKTSGQLDPEVRRAQTIKRWGDAIVTGNVRLLAKFENLLKTLYGGDPTEIYSLAKSGLTRKIVKGFKEIGITKITDMKRMSAMGMTPTKSSETKAEIKAKLDEYLNLAGVSPSYAVYLWYLNVSPEQYSGYRKQNVSSISDMLMLVKAHVSPENLKALRAIGIDDLDTIAKLAESARQKGVPLYSLNPKKFLKTWQDLLRSSEKQQNREALVKLKISLREEYKRNAPKLLEVYNGLNAQEQERIKRFDSHLHMVTHARDFRPDLFAKGVVWVRTIIPQAYSQVPYGTIEEISSWADMNLKSVV